MTVKSPLTYECIFASGNKFQIFHYKLLYFKKTSGMSTPHFASAVTIYINLWNVMRTVCHSCVTCRLVKKVYYSDTSANEDSSFRNHIR